jgi:transcription elongation factor Elf1
VTKKKPAKKRTIRIKPKVLTNAVQCPRCETEVAYRLLGALEPLNGAEITQGSNRMAPQIRCGSCRLIVTLLEGTS